MTNQRFRDTITSILCGMVIFSFLGFLAVEKNEEITKILRTTNYLLKRPSGNGSRVDDLFFDTGS